MVYNMWSLLTTVFFFTYIYLLYTSKRAYVISELPVKNTSCHIIFLFLVCFCIVFGNEFIQNWKVIL